VYSASKTREEFSNYDVTVRGSISIGRRLSDPLAELVKLIQKPLQAITNMMWIKRS
jgi:uncharacterized protein